MKFAVAKGTSLEHVQLDSVKTDQNLSHLFKQSLYISDFVFKRFRVLSLVAILLNVLFGSMTAMFPRAHLFAQLS